MIWLDQLFQDVRTSTRTLARSPRFTVTVIITLALAIGGTTAIFNVADEALFRPLPLPEPEQLTAVYNYNEKTAAYSDSSYPDYVDYRDRATSFEQLSAYSRFPFAVSFGGYSLRVQAEAVTPNHFRMLRLPPLIGSDFENEDAPEALLSERLWREQFGADPAVLGATIRIENQPFTIIGVVPASYRGANFNWSEPPELWIPLRAVGIPVPRIQAGLFAVRPARWLVVLGRRKADVTVEAAQDELQSLAASIAAADPANQDVTAVAFEASRSKFWPAYRDTIALSLGVFGVASVLLLLLACANVSNLLLERALARRREIAIRLALGAARTALVRQMMVESLLLGTPGFAGALLVSRILARLVSQYPSAIGGIPLWFEPQTDARLLLFGLLVSVMAAALFGLMPAFQATRSGPQAVLKETGTHITRGREQWLRDGMVVAQIALTTILLAAGGLSAKSMLRGYSIDAGFRADNLIVSSFDFNLLPPEARASFERRLLDGSATLPGVESVAISQRVPLVSGGVGAAQAQASTSNAAAQASLVSAGAGFFRTIGISIMAGREFVSADDPTKVAVVSENLAASLWPNANPVGSRLTVKRNNVPDMELDVVGVVRAVRTSSIWEEPTRQVYVPSRPAATQFWILRTRVDAPAQVQAVRELWNRLVPEIPLSDLRTGDEILANALAPQRAAVSLFAAFGVLGITLATIGLYSLTSCSVARRNREIGIRIAVGASPRAVVGRILSHAFALATLGLLIGIAAAYKLVQFAAPLLRETSPTDAFIFLTVAASQLGISALAALIPASRATRVNPAVALRDE